MTPLRDRIIDAARPYLTPPGWWRYPATIAGRRQAVRVAYAWPRAVKGPQIAETADEARIDCSTLTTSILMRVYPEAPWDGDAYAGLQVFRGDILDSPIRTVERMGIGERVPELVDGAWHLVQGWRTVAPPKGHAFLVYSRGGGVIDVLESTSVGLIGPRWKTTTASALAGYYPAVVYIAQLHL